MPVAQFIKLSKGDIMFRAKKDAKIKIAPSPLQRSL